MDKESELQTTEHLNENENKNENKNVNSEDSVQETDMPDNTSETETAKTEEALSEEVKKEPADIEEAEQEKTESEEAAPEAEVFTDYQDKIIDEGALEDIGAALAAEYEKEMNGFTTKKEVKTGFWATYKQVPLWTRVITIFLIIMFLLVSLTLFVAKTEVGFKFVGNTILSRIWGNIREADPYEDTGEFDDEKVDPNEKYVSVNDDGEIVDLGKVEYETLLHDPDVYNVLILGEESLNSYTNERTDQQGRTDVIKMASINLKTNQIVLTSFLRDTYVAIEGYKDNKLNASFSFGGVELLIDTIQKNFNVQIDGYVIVNFDAFEVVVDKVGGVEITLSAEEAAYLNKTNYIADKSQRNVVAGKQTLTGPQALGYCRIRNVVSKDGLYVDFGRATRSNDVLIALFDKYKKNPLAALDVIDDCLEYVRTNITYETMVELIYDVYDRNITTITTLQIPYREGSTKLYEAQTIRGMEVIVPYLNDNIDVIKEKIYGIED